MLYFAISLCCYCSAFETSLPCSGTHTCEVVVAETLASYFKCAIITPDFTIAPSVYLLRNNLALAITDCFVSYTHHK